MKATRHVKVQISKLPYREQGLRKRKAAEKEEKKQREEKAERRESREKREDRRKRGAVCDVKKRGGPVTCL